MVSSVIMAAGSMLQLLPRLLVACPKVDESKFQTVFGPQVRCATKSKTANVVIYLLVPIRLILMRWLKLKYLVAEQSLG